MGPANERQIQRQKRLTALTGCNYLSKDAAMRNFHLPGRSPVMSRNAMVATSSSLASIEAVNVLRAGGNAVDAAITAAGVLLVTEPHMTGIGGDCFALLSLADGKIVGLNGSGRASANATAQWLRNEQLGEIGPNNIHAVTVPGAVDAWAKLLEKYGTYTLSDALGPAISHAHAGVPTSQRTAFDWRDEVSRLSRNKGSSRHLLLNGRAPRVGEIMHFPALAASLEKIATHGSEVFYQGELADDMLKVLADHGSILDHKDFAETKATWCEPLKTEFAGRTIFELPPNGQGITALISLNILKSFNLGALKPDSSQRWHLEIEAMKQATILQHRYIADPEFMDMAPADLLDNTLVQKMVTAINLDVANQNPEAHIGLPGTDTVYLSVVDENGMAVSFINSIYQSFGSGISTENSGICLQNRGACFVTDPDRPNCIGPSKRPRHTIIPGLVQKNNQLEAVFGVMGGAYQPMGHQSVLVNRYIYDMDPQAALDFSRLFHQNGVVGVEGGISAETSIGLAEMGHKLEKLPNPLGGGQFIHCDRLSNKLIGGSDHRKDGSAAGY